MEDLALAAKTRALKKVKITKMADNDREDECEPVSPIGRIFIQPLCSLYIISMFGCKEKIDILRLKKNVKNYLMFSHKRFRSVLREDRHGKLRWVPIKANADDHVIVPALDPAGNYSLNFVDDYAAKLATAAPLDPSLPLWQLHVLNVDSTDAAATIIFRVHHSVADGVSIMSLVFACSRKTSDHDTLPSFPRSAARTSEPSMGIASIFYAFRTFILVIFYTFVYFMDRMATLANFRKDSKTPIKGSPGVELKPKRLAHVNLSLNDVKTVKNVVNGTVNDVILATISAGLVRYIHRIYERRGEAMPSDLLVRFLTPVNLRPAKGIQKLEDMKNEKGPCRWGNELGNFLIPVPMVKYEDPLDYVKAAMAICNRKKLSLEAHIAHFICRLLPTQVIQHLLYREMANTTLTFSNSIAPEEEVEFCGVPITHIAPMTSGQPQALIIYLMSYMEKVTLAVLSAEEVMPDPKQLCLDFVEALDQMTAAARSKDASKTDEN